MRKLAILILMTTLCLTLCTPTFCAGVIDTIAVTDTGTAYTYDEMVSDINLLCQTYPEFVRQTNIGTSVGGRAIPMVILGKPEAPHKVCVQATIHAREYLCTQVALDMIEDYAEAYVRGERTEVLDKTCFYVIPMMNPDGVAIVQNGTSATDNQLTKDFINSQPTTTRWKSNFNGVDLNRNWNVRWDTVDLHGYTGPAYEMWKGSSPESEPEVKALKAVTGQYNFDCFINFHQQGNILYYGSLLASPEVNQKSLSLANTIRGVNGYSIISESTENTEPSYGTFADYVCVTLGKPSCTVEMDNMLPPKGQGHIKSLFQKNNGIFKAVSDIL